MKIETLSMADLRLRPIEQLYDAFPGLLKYLPGPHQKVHANYAQITEFLRKEIEKHQEEWNSEDPRDFIDVYLSGIEKVWSLLRFQ